MILFVDFVAGNRAAEKRLEVYSVTSIQLEK